MPDRIVSNTGPIISLENLPKGFEFIRKLYRRIILPEAVIHELVEETNRTPSDYLKKHDIEDLIDVQIISVSIAIPEIERLDEGERQAISLAHQLKLPLLIEETVGRRVAMASGLQVSGIAGQIIKAHKEN